MSGKTWPGIRMSPDCRDGSVIARTVAARSNALVPVVVRPSMSIETANAVPWLSLFFETISGIRSSSRRCAVIGMHTIPRPCVTMKFRLSGVAFSAAMMKSPSFSRSASSTTITIFPARMSARASSIVANTGPVSWVMVSFPPSGPSIGSRSASTYFAITSTSRFNGSPTSALPSVVTSSVCGISATPNVAPSP